MPKIVAQKKDWVKLGYKLFAKSGISGIVIEKMSKQLNCNKSSFYWHFKTKKEFIHQLANYWVDQETKKIITLTNTEEKASEKLHKLLEISYRKMPYLDFVLYLKRYAIKDEEISNIIDSVDHQRINYVYQLLKDMGYSNTDAKVKSSLLYKHLIGYYELMRNKKHDENSFKEVKEEISQFIDL
ncbi:TetR/AcrR family transcriptional regulator [Winogradskyella sp.]|uniref:TetR/AcrR family transcriptional regulator n=1 Tax=Winogradskyella sp. TaxID=1883156 RepID=UPI003AB762B0